MDLYLIKSGSDISTWNYSTESVTFSVDFNRHNFNEHKHVYTINVHILTSINTYKDITAVTIHTYITAVTIHTYITAVTIHTHI